MALGRAADLETDLYLPEIGQIGGALLLTYYGGQGHRPRWIAAGMLVFALASVLCSTPHYLFGGQTLAASRAAANAASARPPTTSLNDTTLIDIDAKLCSSLNESAVPRLLLVDHRAYHDSKLDDELLVARAIALTVPSKCDDPELPVAQSKVTQTVLTIFFASLFFIGIGSTAVNTLGIPYIDGKRNARCKDENLCVSRTLLTLLLFISVRRQRGPARVTAVFRYEPTPSRVCT